MREIITLWNASEMVFFPLLIPVSLLLLLLLRFRLLRLFRLLLLCYLHFFVTIRTNVRSPLAL